ncbi:hypothetical protein [Nonomuraea sp. NPDC003201]
MGWRAGRALRPDAVILRFVTLEEVRGIQIRRPVTFVDALEGGLADALQDGAIDAATAVRVLRHAQRFIDKHLRNLKQDPPSSWPDFPPAAILNLAELPPFDVS